DGRTTVRPTYAPPSRNRVNAPHTAGFGIFRPVLGLDAELAEFDDRRSTPADHVGRERQRERHPVRLAQHFAVAQDAVVPGRRLDRDWYRVGAHVRAFVAVSRSGTNRASHPFTDGEERMISTP